MSEHRCFCGLGKTLGVCHSVWFVLLINAGLVLFLLGRIAL